MASLGSHRLVHLDLKGCPPQVSYFEQLFPVLHNNGATGLLIEWEDTFPYARELALLGSLGPNPTAGAYTTEEARLILQMAADNGLIVVPLVQTFGHFEFVLKHDKWRHLREVPAYPSSMCPSQSGALPLLALMIKQIVDFHPDIQFLHIGADEVWHMGICGTCSQRSKSPNGRVRLFLDHVTAVAQFVRDTYPHLSVIVWDDMLRPIDVQTMHEYNLGRLVEPMVWNYHAINSFSLPTELWEKYAEVFPALWVASAFKGATGGRQLLPITEHHVSNHVQWLMILEQQAAKFRVFRGIALAGWSRYDHYAAACETLPASVPSLVLCLRVWTAGGYSEELYHSTSRALGFPPDRPLPLNPAPRSYDVPAKLTFPGWRLYLAVEAFANTRAQARSLLDSDRVETWLNPWQVQHKFGNPMQLDSLLPSFKELLTELNAVESEFVSAARDLLYPESVYEWVGTNVAPIRARLKSVARDCEEQLAVGARGQLDIILEIQACVLLTFNFDDVLNGIHRTPHSAA